MNWKRITIKRRKTGYFSELSNQINDNQEALKDYLNMPFNIVSFDQQIKIKKESYSNEQRSLLHQVFSRQMSPFFNYDKVKHNVALLKKENTFTITSGHQLNVYGGPLYVIYKIMDAIRLTERLSEEYQDYNFVPVFWLASEDHDFEEINHLHLFNETLTWNSTQKGPVGEFSLEDITDFKTKLLDKFQNSPDFSNFLSRQYTGKNLAEATVQFLMNIAGEYGILILDANDSSLKASFQPMIEREITTQFSEKEIQKTTEKLESQGLQGQAHARPINLFYINDQSRERIIPLDSGDFEIGEKTISKEDLLKDLTIHPERFSPNVVFRPLYQEFILPNLCYIGGGGEMAYWLQLKGMFDKTEVPFPLIKVRNSIQWIDRSTTKKMEKLGLEYRDLFRPIHEVKKAFVFENAEETLDFTKLDELAENYNSELENSIIAVDKGLEGYAKSEVTRMLKQLDSIKQKLIRHQKKKHDDEMSQIDGIYSRLFPNNGLQERYDNMIPFLAKYGREEYAKIIYQSTDSFEKDLILIVEE